MDYLLLQNIVIGIFWFFCVLVLIGIIRLLYTVKNYFTLLTSIKKTELYNDFQKEIETTNELRALIKEEVIEEIQYTLKEPLYVEGKNGGNIPYDRLKFDEDVNTISTKVYERINPKLMVNIENHFVVHTKNYWILYIHHQTAVIMLQLLKSGTMM